MNLDRLEQMKKKLEDETDTPETNESETGTPETNESETEIGQEYTVTIKNGFINGTQDVTALFRPGDTITVTAASGDGQLFQSWYAKQDTVVFADAKSETTTFTMPAEDVQIEAVYEDNEEQIGAYITNFQTLAEQALGAD